MIKVKITNTMLKSLTTIEQNRTSMNYVDIPISKRNKLRKNSKKKSAYSSNKIEGNPLSEKQADAAIDKDSHQHFLKPEQEIRNYFSALNYLEKQSYKKAPFSKDLILKVQSYVEKGASKEKIGLRKEMPPGVLFAVYDSVTGNPDYIPPEYSDIPNLLDELIDYVNTTNDHPLIIAGIVHYQLVTIHPFEDGNGRTARLMSSYIMDLYDYHFMGIGSLEEYFSFNPDEYYQSLQMGLPALYYAGRDNPPHPEIWMEYFLRMVELYSSKVLEISKQTQDEGVSNSLSHLSKKEKDFLKFLIENNKIEFTPIEISQLLNMTNRTVINRCAKLVENGFVIPNLVKTRIRSYQLSEFTLNNKKQILKS